MDAVGMDEAARDRNGSNYLRGRFERFRVCLCDSI